MSEGMNSPNSAPDGIQSSPGAAATRLRSLTRQLSGEFQLSTISTPGGKSAAVVAADISTFERDLKRREISYSKREVSYLDRIKDLEGTLHNEKVHNDGISAENTKNKFSSLKNIHQEIMSNLDLVKGATTTIMQDQEKDLLRAFRARLFDVQTELDREKIKKDDGAATWITKARQLEAEVDWAKGMADMLLAKNEALRAGNAGLRARYATGEEDRQYLIKQLVSVKKENMVLSNDASKLTDEVAALKEQKDNMPLGGGSGGGGGGPLFTASHAADLPAAEAEQEAALEAAKAKTLGEIKRIKVLLRDQQGGLRAARHKYAAELAGRTELQRLLKQCLLDIRQRIAIKSTPSYALDKSSAKALQQQAANDALASRGGNAGGVVEDKSLELLRSQDRVVSMLYHKAFPVENAGGGAGGRAKELPNPLPKEVVEAVAVSESERKKLLSEARRENDGEGKEEGVDEETALMGTGSERRNSLPKI
mmetsp:Transcript_52393/g.104048  ORF Transcript_52393/g.104048 Transcript_52393/m.104048 type:complete len:481 (+) Transcript_52393:57-1499(+)